MTLQGILVINYVSFDIHGLQVSFSRSIQANGKPNEKVKAEFNLLIDSHKDGGLFYGEKEMQPTAAIDGEISYFLQGDHKIIKTFVFKDASCIIHEESFDSSRSLSMAMNLTVSFHDFKFSEINVQKGLEDLI